MTVRYICTLALEGKCIEPCHHTRPHRETFGCDYTSCLDQPRKCIPFIGSYDAWEAASLIEGPEPDGDSPA